MEFQFNVHEAKTHLSRLIAQVEQGAEIVISRAGKPVARLIPFDGKANKRIAGSAKGEVILSKDFDAPLPKSIVKLFEK